MTIGYLSLLWQDVVDPVADEQLAHFVVNSHMRSRPSSTTNADLLQGSSGPQQAQGENLC